MATTPVSQKADSYRQQIQIIIDSPEFNGRTRLAEFLAYAGEARFQGRTHLDQSEIADRILHRGPNFNPLDDASVRKMATLVRQRLEEYYRGTGAHDRIIVTLPVRSYILQFRELDSVKEAEEQPAVVAVEERAKSSFVLLGLRRWFSHRKVLATALVLLLSASAAVWIWWQRQAALGTNPVWKMSTVRGDFMHSDLDLPGSAILVGPKIGDTGDITARMQFSPEHAVQQAGLLVFENADRYVKLGRQFLSRPALEFGLETQAHYQKPPNTFIYDADAQNGAPVWLSIRRDHAAFEAFTSANGTDWRHFGNNLTMPDALPNARVAIFADHGRTNAPETTARFDHVSIGMEFHDYPPGMTDLSQFAGWRLDTNCKTGPGTMFRENSLAVRLVAGIGACNMEFTTPIPSGDWAVSTKLDFLPSNSALAGLIVQGSRGVFRLIRWDLNGGAITAEHVGHGQANLRDFEGAPAVILRMECKNGILTSSLSRDDIHYEPLSLSVPVNALGDAVRFGIQVARSTWFAEQDAPEARFQYIRRPVMALSHFR